MRKNLFAWSVMAMAGCMLAWASRSGTPSLAAGEPQVEAAAVTLLPADAVAAFILDGSEAHQPEISQTAAWKSLVDSGFRDRLFDLLQTGAALAGPEVGRESRALFEGILKDGISGAVSLGAGNGQPKPYAMLVLHNAAPLAESLNSLLNRTMGQQVQFSPVTIEGREVRVSEPGPQGIQMSWWVDSGHIVFAVGIDAANSAIAVASGAADNISANPLFQSLRESDRFTVDALAFFDAATAIATFGDLPFPEPPPSGPLSIHDFLELLGLANLKSMSLQSGFRNEVGWSRVAVEVDGEMTGVMAMLKQRAMTLEDLPALPPDCSGFFATAFDLSECYGDIMSVVRRFAALAGSHAEDDLTEFDSMVGQLLGGDMRSALLDAFGDVWCVYNDPTGMPIPIGFAPVVCFKLENRDKLMNAVDRMLPMLEREIRDENFQIKRNWKDGDLYFSFAFSGAPIVPTVIVTEDWVVGSLVPGAAQGFVLRQKGELKSWTPNEIQSAALAELPSPFTSVSISDPAPGYVQMLSFAPMAMTLFDTQVVPNLPEGQKLQLPFGVADLPVAQRVVDPMFPNVSVTVQTENGVETWSRHSVPSNPMGSMGASATIPVLVALLLPAVQQAREAARRTQSKNNLKMLALAMHNYHDVYNSFPRGTVENPGLQPDERLSWMYSLAPYMEQAAIYNAIDKDSGWQSDANQQFAGTAIPWLQNPSQFRNTVSTGGMDYVGIAGIGPDAAGLPDSDPKAGIFGYDRATGFRTILDGSSNTLMFGDASARNASWLAGGRESIRGFSQKPYLNGPDGIGSPHTGVVQFAFADGSVRAISVNIDDKVLEALATKAGGEVVGEF